MLEVAVLNTAKNRGNKNFCRWLKPPDFTPRRGGSFVLTPYGNICAKRILCHCEKKIFYFCLNTLWKYLNSRDVHNKIKNKELKKNPA